MKTVTLEEAQANLRELIEQLAVGEELVITRNQEPIARLTAVQLIPRRPRKAGSAKGILTIIQDDEVNLAATQPVFGRGQGKVVISDDNEHLRGFEEYMP